VELKQNAINETPQASYSIQIEFLAWTEEILQNKKRTGITYSWNLEWANGQSFQKRIESKSNAKQSGGGKSQTSLSERTGISTY
jgi:predicted transcriptional regulator